MVATNSWGVLSTISTLAGNDGNAFGNPQSYAGDIDGVLYFYVSSLDQSMQDVQRNDRVSFSISQAEHVMSVACGFVPFGGDPESPLCSRVAVLGAFINVTGTDEEAHAREALFALHPAMQLWPSDHNWLVFKLEVMQLWLVNIYGGAAIISASDYFNAQAH
jgi:hypothetical protein